ncbi:hypothetical protein FRC01_010842, partial [Tulasnella sp. 417]
MPKKRDKRTRNLGDYARKKRKLENGRAPGANLDPRESPPGSLQTLEGGYRDQSSSDELGPDSESETEASQEDLVLSDEQEVEGLSKRLQTHFAQTLQAAMARKVHEDRIRSRPVKYVKIGSLNRKTLEYRRLKAEREEQQLRKSGYPDIRGLCRPQQPARSDPQEASINGLSTLAGEVEPVDGEEVVEISSPGGGSAAMLIDKPPSGISGDCHEPGEIVLEEAVDIDGPPRVHELCGWTGSSWTSDACGGDWQGGSVNVNNGCANDEEQSRGSMDDAHMGDIQAVAARDPTPETPIQVPVPSPSPLTRDTLYSSPPASSPPRPADPSRAISKSAPELVHANRTIAKLTARKDFDPTLRGRLAAMLWLEGRDMEVSAGLRAVPGIHRLVLSQIHFTGRNALHWVTIIPTVKSLKLQRCKIRDQDFSFPPFLTTPELYSMVDLRKSNVKSLDLDNSYQDPVQLPRALALLVLIPSLETLTTTPKSFRTI